MLEENTNAPVMIFSAELSGKTKQVNANRTRSLRQQLDNLGIPYREVIGSYKGQLERSFITGIAKLGELEDIIFRGYSQDCYMYVTEDYRAKLIYTDKEQEIGKLARVTVAEAMRGDYEGFTIDGNKAWVVI